MVQKTMHWRAMMPDDGVAVSEIADDVHPAYPEGRHILMEKQALYPAGCLALVADEAPHTICGYVLSHPWHIGQVPALNKLLGALPADADCLYLHDIALLSQARGQGAAHDALNQLITHANQAGFGHMALCAVNGSGPFWQKLGFGEMGNPPAHLVEQLAAYGQDACYLVRDLAS